jgi:hypothetical protein
MEAATAPERCSGMIVDQSLGTFTTAIASREPAPGAGAAAAAGLALGIACARKAAAITLKHHEHCPEVERAETRLAELDKAALAAGDRDASAFKALLQHEPGSARELLNHGQAFLALITEAQALVAGLGDRIDASMCGDIVAAEALILAADTIARHNLAENQEVGS